MVCPGVVVWLKIRENDIFVKFHTRFGYVVVWLKIRENDIQLLSL